MKIIKFIVGLLIIQVVGLAIIGILVFGLGTVAGVVFSFWSMVFEFVFIILPQNLGVNPWVVLVGIGVLGSVIGAIVSSLKNGN